MTIIRRSVSPPAVLVDRSQPYIVTRRVSRVRAKGSGSGSGSDGGSSPASAAVAVSVEAAAFPVARSPQLFLDFPLEIPPRQMTAREFTAGVSHHWAPLLAMARENAKRAEKSKQSASRKR